MSLEDGTIKGFDIRTAKSDPDSTSQQSSFTLHAHDKAVCTISYNPLVPNVHFYPFLKFFSFWGGSKFFLFIHYNNYTYDFLQLLATGSTDKMVSSFLFFWASWTCYTCLHVKGFHGFIELFIWCRWNFGICQTTNHHVLHPETLKQ